MSVLYTGTCIPGRYLLAGQEGGKASLQRVRMAADGVRGVAVVGALPVEAEVTRRRDEEGLQQLTLSQSVDVPAGSREHK